MQIRLIVSEYRAFVHKNINVNFLIYYLVIILVNGCINKHTNIHSDLSLQRGRQRLLTIWKRFLDTKRKKYKEKGTGDRKGV